MNNLRSSLEYYIKECGPVNIADIFSEFEGISRSAIIHEMKLLARDGITECTDGRRIRWVSEQWRKTGD